MGCLSPFSTPPGCAFAQSHYNQSRLWSRLHTTLVQITRITPMWIYTQYTVLEIFSPFRTFEQLALALKKRVCPEIFHCIEYTLCIQDFWASCAFPKNKIALKIFTALNIYFFIIQDFWGTCACPENRVCPEIFQSVGCGSLPQTRTPMHGSDILLENQDNGISIVVLLFVLGLEIWWGTSSNG